MWLTGFAVIVGFQQHSQADCMVLTPRWITSTGICLCLCSGCQGYTGPFMGFIPSPTTSSSDPLSCPAPIPQSSQHAEQNTNITTMHSIRPELFSVFLLSLCFFSATFGPADFQIADLRFCTTSRDKSQDVKVISLSTDKKFPELLLNCRVSFTLERQKLYPSQWHSFLQWHFCLGTVGSTSQLNPSLHCWGYRAAIQWFIYSFFFVVHNLGETVASNNRYFTFLCDILLLIGSPDTFPSAAHIIFTTQSIT